MRYKYSWELIGFGKYQEVKTEIKEPRENGFYYVRYQGRWMVAEWCSQGWTFLADTSFVGSPDRQGRLFHGTASVAGDCAAYGEPVCDPILKLKEEIDEQ